MSNGFLMSSPAPKLIQRDSSATLRGMARTAKEVAALSHHSGSGLRFDVPSHWRSTIAINPHAQKTEREVLDWFAGLGCSEEELKRAKKFDIPGYVGIAFPLVSKELTTRLAKYLSLWLLWDDIEVETGQTGWRITAEMAALPQPPLDLSRFERGWWDLFHEFSLRRTHRWMQKLCDAMINWVRYAAEEAIAMERFRSFGERISFERQLFLRIVTIGMYPAVQLLEDEYDHELPSELSEHPDVLELLRLASLIVALGNDIFSLGKDLYEQQLNIVTSLMLNEGLSAVAATERAIQMHDEALRSYDELTAHVASWNGPAGPLLRWLGHVRFASLGFTLWEARSPRYSAFKVVEDGKVIQPFLD